MSKDALREFAEKQHPENWELAAQSLFNQIQRSSQAKCLSDLTALISEHYYPKEFVEWKDANCTYLRGSGRYYAINDYPKTVYGDYVPYTIDELFEHWKTNEQ